MDRGAWRATVQGSQRVGHNWATNTDVSIELSKPHWSFRDTSRLVPLLYILPVIWERKANWLPQSGVAECNLETSGLFSLLSKINGNISFSLQANKRLGLQQDFGLFALKKCVFLMSD